MTSQTDEPIEEWSPNMPIPPESDSWYFKDKEGVLRDRVSNLQHISPLEADSY